MTTIHRDWQVAHAALTHAAEVATRHAEAEHAAGEYGRAASLHGLAAALHVEAIGVIGHPSTREVQP